MVKARSFEIREGENIVKFVDEQGKELGRVKALYNISDKKLTIIPLNVKGLDRLEVG